MVTAVATLCVRNERHHIERCLSDLIADGIDVIMIDNESTDDTVALAQHFLGHGLLRIETLPWRGCMALKEMLAAEHRAAADAPHDWIIHVDADEWLCSPREGETLLGGLDRADASGANCVNFLEFVFLPEEHEDFTQTHYTRHMRNYYFFQPSHPRLMRAWKRTTGLNNSASGGHVLGGPGLKLFKMDFLLRHYIALSSGQVRQKYLGRCFSESEVRSGWHNARVGLTDEKLRFPAPSRLLRLSDWQSKAFATHAPRASHYWQWPALEREEAPGCGRPAIGL